MASITITVKNNLYTIVLDSDWAALIVNGIDIPVDSNGNRVYQQTTPDYIDFTAVSYDGEVVNPESNFLLRGDSGADHFCNISYSRPQDDFAVYGILLNVKPRLTSKAGAFLFSQGTMKGIFQHG